MVVGNREDAGVRELLGSGSQAQHGTVMAKTAPVDLGICLYEL